MHHRGTAAISTVAPWLTEHFGYKNKFQVPRVTKIVLNIGLIGLCLIGFNWEPARVVHALAWAVVVCAGVRNNHHLGRIGHYGELCGAAGLVSIHFVNVVGHEPQVSPWGGRERRMTTNPFCCVIPRANAAPVVLDMATSAIRNVT